VPKQPIKITLSIIVPVFNEEKGIENAIAQIYKDATLNPIKKIISSFEVIIIDDGSFDNTGKIIEGQKSKYKNFKIIKHKKNQGLGAAIRDGIDHSSKEYITYLPADGQVFLRDIYKGLEVAPMADLILTYRDSRLDYNMYRHMLSSVLMIFMKIFFDLNFKDYNWVHIYKKNSLYLIKTKSKGVFYLGEVVARMHVGGFKILEAEAGYNPRSTGVSKNARLTIALQTLFDLLKLWWELKFKIQR